MAINLALLKHGYSNFQLEILEYTTREEAIKIEQHYLDLLNESDKSLTYNILIIAGSRLGHQVLDEAKLRLANLGELNPNFGKGKPLTDEQKISETMLKLENHPRRGKPGITSFLGKTHSSETKELMSKAKVGTRNFGKDEANRLKLSAIRGSAVEVSNIETNIISTYFSYTKAGEALSCSTGTISLYIKSKKIFRGKYLISKLDNNGKGEDGGEGNLKSTDSKTFTSNEENNTTTRLSKKTILKTCIFDWGDIVNGLHLFIYAAWYKWKNVNTNNNNNKTSGHRNFGIAYFQR